MTEPKSSLTARARNAWMNAKALKAFARLTLDPSRLGEVFEMADALSSAQIRELERMVERIVRDPAGARAFEEKPRLGRLDLDTLGSLPEGTLGRAFAEHMRKNGLDPAALPTIRATSNPEYLRAHLYETHDIWHAVVGFDTDVAGELGLQAFYLAQTGGPLPRALLALGFVNGVLFAPDDFDARAAAIARGWTLGRMARPLFGVDWAGLWEVSVDEVRASLGLVEANASRASDASDAAAAKKLAA